MMGAFSQESKVIHCWNIYQSHFVYMLDSSIENSDYFFVVELEGADELSAKKALKEIRIKKPDDLLDEISYDQLGLFQSKYLFVANKVGVRSINLDKLMK